jgi:hypothetical protein
MRPHQEGTVSVNGESTGPHLLSHEDADGDEHGQNKKLLHGWRA